MKLLHMRPILTSDDQADARLAHSELGRDLAQQPAAGVELSDFDNVCILELGTSDPFATRHVLRVDPVGMVLSAQDKLRVYPQVVAIPSREAILGQAVLHVVFRRPQEKVAGVLTKGLITPMQNEVGTGINPVLQEVNDPVGVELPLLILRPITEMSIALNRAARPQPAISRSLPDDVRPQSFEIFRGNRQERSKILVSHSASWVGCFGQSRRGVGSAARLALFCQEAA